MNINLSEGDTLVTLTVRVHIDNKDELVDALNEKLNTLAAEDVINDDFDDAWAWEDKA